MIQPATPLADFGTDRVDLTPPGSETRATEEAADDEAGRARSAPDHVETDEVDELEALGDQIATLSAHIHAATHQLLILIAEFDERRGWEADGHRSCAHWLAFRTGIELVTAREKVRVARALRNLPQISAAMSNGAISFAKARALTRSASAENEGELLAFARDTTAAQLERTLRSMKLLSRQDEIGLERERHRWRSFSVFPDGTGMYEVRGRLDPEVAAVLMRATEAASDALYRSMTGAEDVEPEQRRADALGLVAERALAAGLGEATPATAEYAQPSEDASAEAPDVPATGAEPLAARDHDAPQNDSAEAHDIARASEASQRNSVPTKDHGTVTSAVIRPTADASAEESRPLISGSRAERYQVVLYVDADTLRSGVESGRSELEDGTRLSPETARRLSCDASVVNVARDRDGSVLDVGRRTRTIPPALRRALEVRDGGCRFPGCGSRFVEAHHVVHWADGGVSGGRKFDSFGGRKSDSRRHSVASRLRHIASGR